MSSPIRRWSALILLALLALTANRTALAQPSKAASPADQSAKREEAGRLFQQLQRAASEGQPDAAIAAGTKLLALHRELEPNALGERSRLIQLIADQYHAKEDFANEKKLLQEVLSIYEQAVGKQDWRTHDARLALYNATLSERMSPANKRKLAEAAQLESQVASLAKEAKWTEAIALLEKDCALRKEALGEQHRSYVDALQYLALAKDKAGQNQDLESLLKQIVAARKKILGEAHPDTAQSLQDLAVWLANHNRIDEADPLMQQVLAARQKSLGDESPQVVQTLQEWASMRARLADYARAAELYRHAAKIVEKTNGPESEQYLNHLERLADMLYEARKFDQAEPLYRQIAATWQKSVGTLNPRFWKSVLTLAMLYAEMGEKEKAESLTAEVLRLAGNGPNKQGPDHIDVLNDAAEIYSQLKNAERSAELVQQALEFRKQSLGEKDRGYLVALRDAATLFYRHGDLARSAQYLNEGLEIITRNYGEQVPAYFELLRRLAKVQEEQGSLAEAEKSLIKIVELTKAAGEDQVDYRDALLALANHYYLVKDDARADATAQQSIDWASKATSTEPDVLATTYQFWGNYHSERGDAARAMPLCRQAAEAFKQVGGEDSLQYGRSLARLAQAYQALDDPKRALPLYEQSAAIIKRVQGEQHNDYASLLQAIGLAKAATGDISGGADALRRSVEIRRQVLGADHLDLARSLYAQAVLFHNMKVYNQAEPRYRQALEIVKKHQGTEADSLQADLLGSLAGWYRDQGDFANAEPLMRQSMEVQQRVNKEPEVDKLISLARLLQAQRKFGEAMGLAVQAMRLARREANLFAAVQSERQQLATAQQLRSDLDTFVSAALAAHAPAETIYQEVLASKGVVFMQQRMQRLRARALQRDASSKLGELLATLESKGRELAGLARRQVPMDQAEQQRQQVAKLSEEIEQLQGELAGLEPQRTETPVEPLTVNALEKLLPDDALLIDALEFRDFVPPTETEKMPGYQSRVVVFLLRKGKPASVVMLGAADELAKAVDAWRKAVVETPGKESAAGAELTRLVWQPLAEAAAGCSTILISPDGPLARFPLGALPGSKPGSYLLEQFAFATVPVAQSLGELFAPPSSNRGSAEELLVVGDVKFGGSPGGTEFAARGQKRSAARGEETSDWKDLPATREEASAVGAAFEKAFGKGKLHSLSGEAATEEQIRQRAPQCRYLHLATHGFFSAPEEESAGLQFLGSLFEAGAVADSLIGDGPQSDDAKKSSIETSRMFRPDRGVTGMHPGLLSGIVLAGANAEVDPRRDDGILTALEVGELDLSRVDMVTLSACETGLGESAGGEGLLGLQRAFQVAGARSVVASLWQVPDDATRALMSEFCQNLWSKKLSKVEALRQAQLTVLRSYDPASGVLRGLTVKPPKSSEPKAPGSAPLYWGAFVLSGDWK